MALKSRSLRGSDIEQLIELVQICALEDKPEELMTPERLRDELVDVGVDLSRDSWLVLDEGRLVACGLLKPLPLGPSFRRYSAWGLVHPDYRRVGLGTSVFRRQLRRARQLQDEEQVAVPAWVEVPIEGDNEGHVDFASALGFVERRLFLSLTRDLGGGPVQQDQLPPGVRLIRYDHALEERLLKAHNEVWTDHWGSVPRSLGRWQAWVTQHRHAALEMSFVAMDGDEIAGYTMSSVSPTQWPARGYTFGYTKYLGVRRPWRRQGLATALLAAATGAFAQAGLEKAELVVDANGTSGALELYQGLGYHVRHRQLTMAYDLPPGNSIAA